VDKIVKNTFLFRFYLISYPNRKLQLNLELGTAELKMLFYGGSSRKPTRSQIVTAPTYSMLALLLFNEHSQLTFQVLFLMKIFKMYKILI
jgi:hypothetical protein